MKKFTNLGNIGTVWNNIDSRFLRKGDAVVPSLIFKFRIDDIKNNSENGPIKSGFNIQIPDFMDFKEFVDKKAAEKYIEDQSAQYMVLNSYRRADEIKKADWSDGMIEGITDSVLVKYDIGIYELYAIKFVGANPAPAKIIQKPYIIPIELDFINKLSL